MRAVTLFDKWITKKQLADALGMSISFINKWMKYGLPCRRFGRAVRFRLYDVTAWLERNTAS
jgi:excisionase family DNA binding protein